MYFIQYHPLSPAIPSPTIRGKSIWHAGRQPMFRLNQIEGIVSEKAYSVKKYVGGIIWQGILYSFLLLLVLQDKPLPDYLFYSSDL